MNLNQLKAEVAELHPPLKLKSGRLIKTIEASATESHGGLSVVIKSVVPTDRRRTNLHVTDSNGDIFVTPTHVVNPSVEAKLSSAAGLPDALVFAQLYRAKFDNPGPVRTVKGPAGLSIVFTKNAQVNAAPAPPADALPSPPARASSTQSKKKGTEE